MEKQDETINNMKEYFESNMEYFLSSMINKNIVNIDFNHLSEELPDVADLLIERPGETIQSLEIAIEETTWTPKDTKVRLVSLSKSQNIPIREIRAKHLGKMISIEGTIRQASEVRPVVTNAKFECPSCGTIISILQSGKKFKEPTRCSCGRRGSFKELCKDMVDSQNVVVEEPYENLENSSQPKKINVSLLEDLTEPKMENKTTPGSRVLAIGILKEVERVKYGSKELIHEIIIEANNIIPLEDNPEDSDMNEEDEKQIKELSKENPLSKIVSSFAPSIYGYENVKRAIVLQLFGGNRVVRSDGTRRRGNIHCLVLGDPGLAKSTLLKYATEFSPKARFVSGKGTSGVGISASVIRDELTGDWSLQAGALVLANNGILALDECFRGETEVLTNKGFVKFNELKNNDIVGQYHKNGTIDFIKPERIIKKHFNGNLIKLSGAFGEHISTPNHLRVTRKLNGEVVKEKIMDSLVSNRKIITAGNYFGDGVLLSDEELKFIIAFMADGCIKNKHYGYVSFKKINKKKNFKKLCEKIGIKFTLNKSTSKNGGTYYDFYLGNEIDKYFPIINGKHVKKYPSDWLTKLSLYQRRLIINELKNWDGYTVPESNCWQYFTSKEEEAKIIQEIAITSGFHVHIYPRKKEGYNDNYSLTFIDRDYKTQQNIKIKEIYHNGNVYCVTVPTGMIIIREGYNVQITGNCDKMKEEDRSNLHEAMSIETLTIAKANIQACLQTRTAILAAGNPKYSRFNHTQPIIKQINLSPTLLNRFDCIFILKDIPNEDMDDKIAESILSDELKEGSKLDNSFIRKYISYAKKNIHPKMTNKASLKIREFYVGLRKDYKDQAEISIPIGARQLESLVRIAEASAKCRLSESIDLEDAELSINVMLDYLSEVGLDKETGKFDMDVLSGTSSSERSKMKSIMDYVKKQSLLKDNKRVSYEELVEFFQDKIGVDSLDSNLSKLNSQGDLIKTKDGYMSI